MQEQLRDIFFLPGETKSTQCPFNLETKENKGKQMEAKLSSLEICFLHIELLVPT